MPFGVNQVFLPNKAIHSVDSSTSNLPTFYMMVGLPYSGKTYEAQGIRQETGAVIHSSDEIRQEVLGDIQDQNHNAKVFEILHNRILADLKLGKSVIYDATNISYKRRMAFLQMLSKIPCKKHCVFMATPFDVCVSRSKYRARQVPYEVLERMYRSIFIPQMYEGWDCIELVFPGDFKTRDVTELFNGENGLNFISHDNPHHTFTVGHHCAATYGLIHYGSDELQEAAMLHDIGKRFTKTFVNTHGETTDVAHYYDHQNVSAYESLFYVDPSRVNILRVAAIIQWHMRPFELERKPVSQNAVMRFRKLLGESLYRDVMTLHEADIRAK